MAVRKYKGFSVEDYTNDFLGKGTRVVVVTVIMIMVIFPLYWLASNSIKTATEYLKTPPVIVPTRVTLDNYIEIFTKSKAGRALYNTVMVASLTTILCVSIGSFAAYAIAKGAIREKVRNSFSLWFMIQKMYPAVCVAIPIYLVMRGVGLIDTIPGLVIVNTSFNLPMTIWLMIGFFQDVPDGIEQSGKIDGCNMFQRFFYLVLPISKPGIVASAILVFNAAWNEFLFSAILSINKSKTLSVVISGFITDKGLEWGPRAALSMVLIVPVVVLVWFLQRDFVSGLTMGSVKE